MQKYYATNKVYKKQVKAYAKQIKKYPLQDSGLATTFVGTTNFNMRKPNFVIIHHTAQNSCDQTLKTFTLTRTEVSAHYVICRQGNVVHMLNNYLRAWHGGAAKWGNVTDINSASIGIELDNNGTEPFSESQMQSLLNVLAYLKKAYSIPTANFIGHADIAPQRKNDPSKYFNWQMLAQKGFGHWYDTTKVTLPLEYNYKTALRVIGYNTAKEGAAIQAFKLHFNSADTTATLTNTDKKILIDLVQKY